MKTLILIALLVSQVSFADEPVVFKVPMIDRDGNRVLYMPGLVSYRASTLLASVKDDPSALDHDGLAGSFIYELTDCPGSIKNHSSAALIGTGIGIGKTRTFYTPGRPTEYKEVDLQNPPVRAVIRYCRNGNDEQQGRFTLWNKATKHKIGEYFVQGKEADGSPDLCGPEFTFDESGKIKETTQHHSCNFTAR